MPTARKKETVKELQDLFTKSQVLVFTDYRGMSVAEITNLRRQLREKGVEYHVAKNTLTTIAADHTGMQSMQSMLDGPTAIAFIGDDIPGGAKALGDFVRTSRVLQIRGGLMGGTVLSPDQISDLTKILSREQYIAKIMGSMQSPISGFVSVLSGVMRGFVTVLQARADQMAGQADGTTDDATPEAAAPEATSEAAASESAAPEATPEVAAPEAATPEADEAGA